MKRAFVGFLLCSAFTTAHLRAADAVTLAVQQESEERYKNLSARVDEMQAAQLALERRIGAIASDLSKLRDEVSRNNTSSATQESIRKLNEQIVEVDKNRVADNRRVQEGFEKLEKLISKVAAAPPRRTETSSSGSGGTTPIRTATNTSPVVQDGFEYTVQPGDNHLGVIVKRFNDEKIMVTSKMIMDANPTVDWRKLKIGQKIMIPKPK
jgi:TolA-binding protein